MVVVNLKKIKVIKTENGKGDIMNYEYDALVTRVIDGDTFEAIVDLGFNMSFKGIFRLKDIDTPETWRPSCDAERKHGEAATRFVESLILNQKVTVITHKAGAGIYGRYTADVIIEDERNLKDLLIAGGFKKENSYEDLVE